MVQKRNATEGRKSISDSRGFGCECEGASCFDQINDDQIH